MEIENNSIESTPLVTIGLPVWNGELFLAKTLQSLVSQTYQNLEIIILDNQSTDKTVDICNEFAKKDTRIKFIIDEQKRGVIEGHNKVATIANGDFFMVVCDDDVYAPTYIEKLISIMHTNPDVGLVYSGWAWIDERDNILPINWKWFIKVTDSKVNNFIKYLFKRSPLPICFGLIRTEIHRDALQYFVKPDDRGWNHDNLYMLRLLSKTLIESTTEILFFYRQRDRIELYKKRGQYSDKLPFLKEYLKYVLHNFSYHKVTLKIIDNSGLIIWKRYIFKAMSFFSMLHFITIKKIHISLLEVIIPFYKKIKS